MNILFLCVGNSIRSQMAEGLAKHILGPSAQIHSAGSAPMGEVHPGAIAALKEINIDISDQHSKSISDLPRDFVDNLDYVITLCAEEVCPALIGQGDKTQKLHWAMPDPSAAIGNARDRKAAAFRAIRDAIANKLKALKNAVVRDTSPT